MRLAMADASRVFIDQQEASAGRKEVSVGVF